MKLFKNKRLCLKCKMKRCFEMSDQPIRCNMNFENQSKFFNRFTKIDFLTFLFYLFQNINCEYLEFTIVIYYTY